MADLFEALAMNRQAIEQALPDARRTLAELQKQCADLKDAIRIAEVTLGHADVTPPAQAPMHVSMVRIIETQPNGLPAPEIARILDEEGLYRTKKGKAAGVGQVHARVNNYPKLFVRDSGRIRLRTDADH